MKTFIKQEREKRGILQKDLAAALSIATPTLSTYENTDRDPPLDILCEIADRFDCSLDLLVRGKEKDLPKGRSMEELIKRLEGYSLPELRELIALATYLQYRKEREQAEGQGSADGQ